jgi:CheY-like chemotaxis protein/nitrogen-specific signal transduction histidine kinase
MRSYRVLIVDDDAVDRRLYGRLLTQPDPDTCNIHHAVTGTAGLAALRAEMFDCVLLDLNLPDMTGLEFLTAAALNGELPCAIVLIAGQGSEATAVEAMKLGAQDYLVKDQVNADSLWRAVRRAVAHAQLNQRLAGSSHDLGPAKLVPKQEAAMGHATEAEFRAAKGAAEHANQAKTRFAAMVAHELRTPLDGILGYAQLLRIQAGLSAWQDAHVGAMMQAGRHLLEMIEPVPGGASTETGQMELLAVQVSVRDLAEGCIAFISPMATERALSLRVVTALDAPRQIIADPARLRQVLLNLLGNAVKYADAGSVELRVLAGASPGGLRIEIADTGRGIDEASRDRLFQDVERLETADSEQGTGSGLAAAARIAALMGATISHFPNPNDASPNGGSVFWLDLPTAQPVSSPLTAPLKGASPPSGRCVLLVDDIKINRDIIGSFLGAAGHTVIMAEGGQESVQLAAGQKFDLILMDVRMPEMDGLEATRRIRTLPASRGQVPILALTAYTFPDQMAQFLDAGMDGHLPKPVDYQTLMTAIDDTIARIPPFRAAAFPAAPLN